MLRPLVVASLSFIVFITECFCAPGNGLSAWDAQFSSLYAVDSRGREVGGTQDYRSLQEGKFVGVFYFLWHGAHEPTGPWDLSRILQDPEPQFGPLGAFHHWAEPELGYYLSDDPYVFSVHAEWLSAARVDTIVIDVTNGHTYEDNLEVLCETWIELRKNGNPTPQIAFLAKTRSDEVVRNLYDSIYSKGRFQELWFEWNGKPLILAPNGDFDSDIMEFFTFRESWAWTSTKWFGDGRDKWAWLDNTPQQPGLNEEGQVEQISVSVAQHATANKGRSYSKGREPPEADRDSGAGIYFAEQWERALEVDPGFIFITGWNEWVAQRFLPHEGGWTKMAGRELGPADSVFVDAYTQEFSRDVEPMKGGYGKDYYYQMVDGIRQFKGAAPSPVLGSFSEIAVDGDLRDWENSVAFSDFEGERFSRVHDGWGTETFSCSIDSNDFVETSVALGQERIFVALRCSEEIHLSDESKPLVLRLSFEKAGEQKEFVVSLFLDQDEELCASSLSGDGIAVDLVAKSVREVLELSIEHGFGPLEGVLKLRWEDRTFIPHDCRFTQHIGDSLPSGGFWNVLNVIPPLR